MINKNIEENSILIVGLGFAGQRFFKVLQYLKKTSLPNLAIYVCDTDPIKDFGLVPTHQHFSSLQQALNKIRPETVIVTVNEAEHFKVLNLLLRNNIQRIICEKPLTETVQQSELLSELGQRMLSLNLIERFSPVCNCYFRWIEAHPNFKVVRVESHWGKCRILDPRPTIGVLSEIIHPLDLVEYLFGYQEVKIREIFAVESNYAISGDLLLDSIDVVLSTPYFPVIVRSSFVWARRERTVSAILVDSLNRKYVARFEFDNPQWDCDCLEIYRVGDSDTSVKEVLFKAEFNNSDFPNELHGVNKLKEFTLASFSGTSSNPKIVGYSQALRLQKFITSLENEVKSRGNIVRHFFDRSPTKSSYAFVEEL